MSAPAVAVTQDGKRFAAAWKDVREGSPRVWWAFASPRARWGGPVVRPVVKVLVFGLASLGLWAAGHHGWAVALLVFSVVVNGLAQLPSIRALVDQQERSPSS